MKQKIVVKAQMRCGKCRKKALKIAASADGVISVAIQGNDKDEIMIVGNSVDSAGLCTALRKKLGIANLISVEQVKDPKPEDQKKPEEKKPEEKKTEKSQEKKPEKEENKAEGDKRKEAEEKKQTNKSESKASTSEASSIYHHYHPNNYPPTNYCCPNYPPPQCHLYTTYYYDDPNPNCTIM